MGDTEQDRFVAIFDALSPRVYGYVRRHVERDTVEDVVAETFLVAWRRMDEVPDPDPLPWLLVVARNLIANHRRGAARRDIVHTELRALRDAVPSAPAAEDVAVGRHELVAALSALTVLERESLLLTAWDGLSDVDAAAVSGCSARAFRVRLHRARRRLDRELDVPHPRHAAATPADLRPEETAS
jgi:RNA polymerase sigma factor (sigma-70 family)